MIFWQRSREGYMHIDHQSSPGVPEPLARKAGLAGFNVGEGSVVELSTLTCSHCKTVQIKNPMRQRERGHCFKCNHYICDLCATVQECRPWAQVVDDVLDGKTPVPVLVRPV